MDALKIRAANREEFATAVEWAAGEGWNPGLDDREAFHRADPDGFLMGWKQDKPVPSISVVRYGGHFGFLGFYIVRPDHRGTRAGIATWRAGMDHLAGRTISLEWVPDQQQNYKKSGFNYIERKIRFTGAPRTGCAADKLVEIRELDPTGVRDLVSFDRPFFPAPRESFITDWVDPISAAWRQTKIAVLDGDLVGYGTIRECRSGYKIGPLKRSY